MAVERFLYNLTRPTDQRHQPVPKKRESSSLGGLPSYLAPALGDKKGGKMKVTLIRKLILAGVLAPMMKMLGRSHEEMTFLNAGWTPDEIKTMLR